MGCVQSNNRCVYTNEKKSQSLLLDMKPSSENRPELSEEHKEIVRETWSIIKLDIERVGVVMFMR